MRRIIAAFLASIVLNVAVVNWLHDDPLFRAADLADRSVSKVTLVHTFVVPTPLPTPPAHWETLDPSAIKYARMFAERDEIVLLAAKQGNGRPSNAPHIFHIEITPGRVREHTRMHMRVLTSPDANGVYVRFAIWEIAVTPVAPGRFPPSDPDFPGRPYERFERDYVMPAIPRIFRGHTYNAEVAAVSRKGFASGAFVRLYLER